MMEGKPSTMTPARARLLEDLNFAWHSHTAIWMERFLELMEFRERFGHCSVPSTYGVNPQLAVWVKCQRRQYKLHREGRSSGMTEERIRELERAGFVWCGRIYPRQKEKEDYNSAPE
mmetsp:Transcript_29003/g.85800  ORF Transcript_29003/g.85800 Transcript_29003/m.85800 type:complete len:117 (-) Transcript_29003:513-863(-)